jgi:hypothetical protein
MKGLPRFPTGGAEVPADIAIRAEGYLSPGKGPHAYVEWRALGED